MKTDNLVVKYGVKPWRCGSLQLKQVFHQSLGGGAASEQILYHIHLTSQGMIFIIYFQL